MILHLRLVLSLGCAAIVAIDSTAALASSVAPMNLQEMADHAGQVIIGTVSSANSIWSDNHHRIETELILTDVDYLKGRLKESSDSFRLVIPGGTVGEQRMSICCAPSPRVGQKWMFFLLPTYRTFPVVGIYSGAFRIQADANGIERVYRDDHGQLRGVTGIDPSGFVRVEQSVGVDAKKKLVAAQKMRVVSRPAISQSAAAINSIDEFRSLIAPTLAASRGHQLTQSAGVFIDSPRPASTLKAKTGSIVEGQRGIDVQRLGAVKKTTNPRTSKVIDQP